ncbi:conserved hypothetical protein [Verticillium alfalfae VaMs.102]|uniref:15-hydroxyprostaglandin dehydrogenase n=1 Tax=Verticillium alfalfae (strain VaMs.102 / ATCC MYA-4576 / FGSC 10136) TaxID=526221 RepID=C9SF63_VERA1|nr:conserved hypothetical protein [Verticillium alfalfae VaMs.102]EEY17849.1 conserved hypothetical protein [Verticillium alfalfae VaMs.102]
MGSLLKDHEKVAIVTGSTSGIGLAVAKHLHDNGYRVVITGRRPEGQATAASIDPTGRTVIFVRTDVASYASQANLFKVVWDTWGRLDIFIANAGGVDEDSKYNFRRRDASIDDIPPEPNTTCTDTHFKGVIYGTTLATHFMRHNETPGGKIVITGSMIGLHTGSTFPEYSSAKAAVHHWTRTMAAPLKLKENITINCVMPGAVDTPAMPNFSEAFQPEHLTLMPTLIEAYDVFIKDESNEKTGQLVEVAHDKHFYYDLPEYKGGDVSYRNTLAFEPWFSYIHGEKSGLKDALEGPPTFAARPSFGI